MVIARNCACQCFSLKTDVIVHACVTVFVKFISETQRKRARGDTSIISPNIESSLRRNLFYFVIKLLKFGAKMSFTENLYAREVCRLKTVAMYLL